MEGVNERKKAQNLGQIVGEMISQEGLTPRRVATRVEGIDSSSVYHLRNATKVPSKDLLEKILQAINPDASLSEVLAKAGYREGEYKSKSYARSHEVLGLLTPSGITELIFNDMDLKPVLSSRESFEQFVFIIAAINSLHLLINKICSCEDENGKIAASEFIFQMIRRHPSFTLYLLASYIKNNHLDKSDGYDRNITPLILEDTTELISVLTAVVLAEAKTAVLMLEAGLPCGVAGLFMFPIALAASGSKKTDTAVRRQLAKWTKNSQNLQVKEVVRATKKMMTSCKEAESNLEDWSTEAPAFSTTEQ